jgi:tripartite-type tricarboxylate transporter receptor subunit TctC
MQDLLGGRVALSFPTIPSALPHVRSGKLQALAVTSAQRTNAMPDVPTIAESGLPGYEASSWYAVLAPAGTPAPLVARMQQAIAQALEAPDMKQRFAAEGLEPVANEPQAFGTMLEREVVKWSKVVKASGAKVE